MTELSNWGRWGKADQIGTLNLITADKRKQALKLARDGVAGVAGAHDRQGEGRRQPAAARTGNGPRRGRPRDGPLLDLVPRLGHHAHRRALPLLVRGKDLQRLRAIGDRSRARLPEQRHREPEGRHHDARHHRRSAAHEERAVSRAGTAVYRVGSRGVGESTPASRSAAATRCSSAPAAGRSAAEKGPWNVAASAAGFHASGHAVAQAARRRAPRQRRRQRRAAVRRGGIAAADPSAGDRRARICRSSTSWISRPLPKRRPG